MPTITSEATASVTSTSISVMPRALGRASTSDLREVLGGAAHHLVGVVFDGPEIQRAQLVTGDPHLDMDLDVLGQFGSGSRVELPLDGPPHLLNPHRAGGVAIGLEDGRSGGEQRRRVLPLSGQGPLVRVEDGDVRAR